MEMLSRPAGPRPQQPSASGLPESHCDLCGKKGTIAATGEYVLTRRSSTPVARGTGYEVVSVRSSLLGSVLVKVCERCLERKRQGQLRLVKFGFFGSLAFAAGFAVALAARPNHRWLDPQKDLGLLIAIGIMVLAAAVTAPYRGRWRVGWFRPEPECLKEAAPKAVRRQFPQYYDEGNRLQNGCFISTRERWESVQRLPGRG